MADGLDVCERSEAVEGLGPRRAHRLGGVYVPVKTRRRA